MAARRPAPVLLARGLAGAALCAALALAPLGGALARKPPPGGGFAEPGDIIAVEIALSRQAAAKGQWKAYDTYAARGAQLLGSAPARLEAIAGNKPPALPALRFSTEELWMSCDGSVAVSTGRWVAGDKGPQGPYTLIWRRQKKGLYRFVGLSRGAATTLPDSPEMIDAHVADCALRNRHQPPPPAPPKFDPAADFTSGKADDGTLAWQSTPGGTALVITARSQGQWREVMRRPLGASQP